MTHIWVPNRKFIENRDELIAPARRIAGKFKFSAMKPDGRIYPLTDWIDNIITAGGMNRMGTGAAITHIVVGTGTTPVDTVTFLDSALTTFLAAASASETGWVAGATTPYAANFQYLGTFSPRGSAANVSEIGLAWANNGGSLLTRANISPVVSWLGDETLLVTYIIYNYPMLDDNVYDVEFSTPLGNVTRTVTARASYAGSSTFWAMNLRYTVSMERQATYTSNYYTNAYTNGAIGAITGVPSGTAVTRSSFIHNAYVSNSYQRTGVAAWLPAVANHAEGVTGMLVYGANGVTQYGFVPGLPKTSNDTLTLNVCSPFWGRHAA